MAGRITQSEDVERKVAADRLNALAGEFRDEGTVRVEIGNKTVELHPPEDVQYNIDVVETKRRFRRDRENIRIELSWQPESGE